MSYLQTLSAELLNGTVSVKEWNQTYIAPGAVEVATLFHDSTYEGKTYRSFTIVAEAYVGKVVAFETRSEQVMSDIWENITYAWCANDDGSFIARSIDRHLEGFYSTIDAPASLIAAWKTWMAQQEENRRERERQAAIKREEERAAREAATPRKGKTIKVVRGRKVPKGTTGECIWYGETKYGYRVGLKVEGQSEPLWTDAKNVEVVQAAV